MASFLTLPPSLTVASRARHPPDEWPYREADPPPFPIIASIASISPPAPHPLRVPAVPSASAVVAVDGEVRRQKAGEIGLARTCAQGSVHENQCPAFAFLVERDRGAVP